MPRRLILMRHAKSAWPEGVADFDRPLAPRGRAAAPLMAKWLVQADHRPDVVLVSSARRTQETWQAVATELPAGAVRIEPAIYNASAGALLSLLRGLPDECSTAMFVGHNPGTHELAFGLADPASSDKPALQRLSRKYPTAGVALLESDAPWSSARPAGLRLAAFMTPSALGGVDED